MITLKNIILFGAAIAACFMLSACGGTAQSERAAGAKNQASLVNDTPVPGLTHSEERQNLVKRAERLNQNNMTGCVSLLSNGSLVASFVTDGKVSSLNSYLLPSDYRDNGASGMGDPIALEAPDIDGAYGENVKGAIFFFTAETNAYVEWKGDYLFTDQCLSTHQEPLLVREVK